jgi:N-methylhydantoinase B/oxoprolinase/acetone carboxylase alpha subunit
MKPGEKLTLKFGGGAGYGPPANRDPAAIENDLRNGYITSAFAKQYYGVSGEGE